MLCSALAAASRREVQNSDKSRSEENAAMRRAMDMSVGMVLLLKKEHRHDVKIS